MTQEAPDSQADVYGRRLCNRYSSQRSRSQSREALEEEHMVLNEIEHVLHEAAKRLFQERELVRRIPIPMKKPEELLVATCPAPSDWGDFIPNPDYWANWLARWLAVCLPAQEDLQAEVLRETSLWAQARAGGPYTDGTCLRPVTGVARAIWIYLCWL